MIKVQTKILVSKIVKIRMSLHVTILFFFYVLVLERRNKNKNKNKKTKESYMAAPIEIQMESISQVEEERYIEPKV